MSRIGYVLAGLNIVGAIAFVVLGLMDYARGKAWASANFAHDVAIHGLPLGAAPAEGEQAVAEDQLPASTKKEWFGDNAVSTQVQEVEAVKKAVDAKITSAAGGDRDKETVEMARILTPFAQHNSEREWLLSIRNYLAAPEGKERLKKRLHDAFPAAVDACQARPEDLKFPKAFMDACAAEGPPPAVAFEQTFLRLLPAKPENTFDDAVKAAKTAAVEAPKPPPAQPPPLEEAKDAGSAQVQARALAFLKSIRGDANATLAKPGENKKDTLDDVIDATLAAINKQLKDQLEALYAAAKNGPKSPDPTKPNENLHEGHRAAVAHYLMNMVEALHEDAPAKGATGAPEYTRVVAVVGLKAAAQELNDQASVMQRIGRELQEARDLERGEFAAQHRALISDLQNRAIALHEAGEMVDQKNKQLADENVILKKRQEDVKNAEMELAAARDQTKTAMTQLQKSSDSLQKLRIEARDVLGENLELEKQLRGLENKP
jgi:hypothetical protein